MNPRNALNPLASFVAGAALWQACAWLPRLSILGLAIAAIALLLAKKNRAASIMLITGFALAFARTPLPPPQSWDNPVLVTGYFSGPVERHERFNVQGFVPLKLAADNPSAPHIPKEFNIVSKAEFRAGVPETLALKMITPRQRMNPGAWKRDVYARLGNRGGNVDSGQYRQYESKLKVPLKARLARLRQGLGQEIDASLSSEKASLIKAMTIGQRAGMDEEMKSDFRRAGLAHLMSISGTHFGFFAAAVFFAIRSLISRLPHHVLLRLTLRLGPNEAAALMTLPGMLFYLGISGGSPPSIRAAVMTGLFLLGLLMSARGGWKPFLAAAAFVLTLMEPSVVSSASFLLSFSAVLFIGFALRGPDNFMPEPEKSGKAGRLLRSIILRPVQLTLAATFGVLPLLIHWFHEISLISPLANVLATPLAGFLVVPLSIVGAVSYALGGPFITAPLVDPLAGLLMKVANLSSSPAWAAVSVPPMPPALIALYYACVLPWLVLRRRRLIWLCLLPIAAYAMLWASASMSKKTSVTFLDTGRSDAAIVELPGRRAVVVDTGYTGTPASLYLRHMGIKKIEAVVLTHNHHDHTGGAPRLARYNTIKEVWDNGMIKIMPELKGIPQKKLEAGRRLGLPGGAFIDVLHPSGDFDPDLRGRDRTNNNSLVLRLATPGGGSALFTGDIKAEAVEYLRRTQVDALKSAVLKMPHHGKQPDNSHMMVGLSQPEVAVVTGPDDMSAGGMGVLSTGTHGAIKVDITGPEPEVKTYKEFAMMKSPPTIKDELDNLIKLFKTW